MLKFVAFYSKKYDTYSKKASLNKSSDNCLPLFKKKKIVDPAYKISLKECISLF